MFSFFKRFKGNQPESAPPADAQRVTPIANDSGSPSSAGVPGPGSDVSSGVVDKPRALEPRLPESKPYTPQPHAPQQQTPLPQTPQPRSDLPSADTAPKPAPTPTAPPAVAAPPTLDPVEIGTKIATPTGSATGRVASPKPPGFDTPEFDTIVPPPPPEPAARNSWLARLRSGLSKTSAGLTGIFVGVKIDEALFEELETALLVSDAGVDATEYLLGELRLKIKSDRLTEGAQVKAALRTMLVELFKPLEKSLVLGRAKPLVIMIAGVNGAGKTTSIGKLAKHLQHYGQSVLLAAGDTFRAAAREQLAIWGERNQVTVISQDGGDPAAVIFDAVGAARARNIDVLMADTAGRLPTQLHLMEELRKVKRVTAKAMDGAPHEVLLVIDANTGQNALAQVKAFDDALGLTGLIVTKLDGTAKGGILAAIARQRPIPVYFIGVGEKVEDLQPFSATEFADALLG